MRCRVTWSLPEKRGETMVRRKWFPPAFAPAWPACFPDSSRRSMDCGSSAPRRSWMAADRSIRSASRRFLLDVARQKQRLQHNEREHQAHAAEELEIDPGIGGEVVGDEEVGRPHESEEGDPAPVESEPDAVGHSHLCSEHRSNQIPAEQQLGPGKGGGEQPIEDGRLPLDERLVVQRNSRPAEHHDNVEAVLGVRKRRGTWPNPTWRRNPPTP